jgi:hypothetical protein
MAEGVRWTMTDSAAKGKSYGELRSGVIAGACVQDFVNDFGEAWTSDSTGAAMRYRATLRIMNAGQLQSQRIVSSRSQDQFSEAIPTTDRFTAMWRDATAIGKGFWYGYIGPITNEGRAGVTIDFSVEAWRIAGAFSDGLEEDNVDFGDSPEEGSHPIGVP